MASAMLTCAAYTSEDDMELILIGHIALFVFITWILTWESFIRDASGALFVPEAGESVRAEVAVS